MKQVTNTRRDQGNENSQQRKDAPRTPKPAAPATSALARRADGDLPAPQRAALAAITAGRGLGEAAQAAGVSRQTLHNWRRTDVRFAALYNSWQAEVISNAQTRLLALVDAAVTAIGNAIQQGDTHVALEVLRRMGILAPVTPGSENPDQLQRERELAEREKDARLTSREQYVAMDPMLAKLLERN